uniref:Uncharacterized protein n=1 Tax=Myoviridae sp. ctCo31 TaxID=2825053 RepID=A0A8S5UMF4_9CAUD|nr:MAG TPA: hypothetical protein [Myoviridae sp. ctCo31]
MHHNKLKRSYKAPFILTNTNLSSIQISLHYIV